MNATGAFVHPKPGANDRIGEIIAAGWNTGHPVQQTKTIVTGWMNSPGHRKEILTKQYKKRGIGCCLHTRWQRYVLVRGLW